MITSIIVAILIFGILIFIHELGHYSVAKWCDIKIDEFSIGMGPKIFGFTKGETLYAVRAIPFGGYVKMEGEEVASNDKRAFYNKPAWQRLLVVIAGSVMHLLLGFLLILFLVISIEKLPNMTVEKFMPDAVTPNYGLLEGDKILKIDNYKLKAIGDLNYILVQVGDRAVDVVVMRNNEIVSLKNVKFPIIEDKSSGLKVATLDFEIGMKEKTLFDIIGYSYNSVVSNVKSVWVSISGLIKGKYNLKAMAGPVQITEMISTVSADGFRQLIKFVALISVNLGVLNLLPIPALDGGKIIFLLFELVTKKRIKPEWESYISLIGFGLLMLLSVVVTYNDIIRLVQKYTK